MTGNALAVRNNKNAVATNAYDPFAENASDMAGSNGVYLKFNGNSGEFTYGAEAEELPEGTLLAVNMQDFRRGWICWVDSQVVDEVMVRIVDERIPDKNTLADHGPYVVTNDRKDGWSEQAAMSLRDIETGKEFIYKTSTGSALRSFGTFLKDFSREYKNHPGEVPVIKLGSSSFMPKNKQWGKKYSPKFEIAEWLSEDELAARFGENAGDYEGGDEGAEDAPVEQAQVEAPKEAPKQEAAPATKPTAAPGARRRAF